MEENKKKCLLSYDLYDGVLEYVLVKVVNACMKTWELWYESESK